MISANNVEIAGAGKTNTTLIAYNRVTTIVDAGLGFGTTYTNITLRDMNIEGQPHRAVLNRTNIVFEPGQYLPADPYTGTLAVFFGASPSSFLCNLLVSNCQFTYANNAIDIPYYVSNCLVTHCDFIMWGGSNFNANVVNKYPTNTLNTVPDLGSVGIFASASPDYNVCILDNNFNGNTNLAPNTNNPMGYVNAYETQLLASDGLVWLQGGGNYFIARNHIINYDLEGVQLNGGPSAVVGNTYYTLVNNDSCKALAVNASEPGLFGRSASSYNTCFIGNQVWGGRHGVAPSAGGQVPITALNVSGNNVTVFPALPAGGSYPGDAVQLRLRRGQHPRQHARLRRPWRGCQ